MLDKDLVRAAKAFDKRNQGTQGLGLGRRQDKVQEEITVDA